MVPHRHHRLPTSEPGLKKCDLSTLHFFLPGEKGLTKAGESERGSGGAWEAQLLSEIGLATLPYLI